ncbi:DUF1365 domain-containing protein [Psychrobacter sp. DM4]|uniref:DUF1365 domain-containing protein n=1 Tax=Psychrobacter sp. DM4 TaxID=3440637 RepID=UPI003F503C32
MTIKATSATDEYKSTIDDMALAHQLFHGTTWHNRLLPSVHKFAYPYRYWGVNISALAAEHDLPEVKLSVLGGKVLKRLPLFSAKHKALQQFYPNDYLQEDDKKSSDDNVQALKNRLNQAFMTQTGSKPTGDMIGMLVCRNVGLYFSPVNFYIGFDTEQVPTHLLAEVSNTPWDKRHYYGFLLEGSETKFCHDKNFHVSPFNPIDQMYRWQVKINKQQDNCLQVRITIDISDARGDVLKTGIKMSGAPMTMQSIQHSLRKNPVMNLTSLSRIYWHAFKLFAIKKVPYVNYDETLADSNQSDGKTKR